MRRLALILLALLSSVPRGEARLKADREYENANKRRRATHKEFLAMKCVPPTADDDLTYFLKAVEGAGPEVGRAREGDTTVRPPIVTPSASLEKLADAVEKAERTRDRATVVRAGTEYLTALGYPGPIDGAREGHMNWGGARYSYVMRSVAEAHEALGHWAESAALHRRANPGGGACGSSTAYRWQLQIEAVIRAEQKLGHCGAVVAERLINVDDAEWDLKKGGYGVKALADKGYDVARLYRGAIATLQQKGGEEWARRVHAIEGFADTARAAALPRLVGWALDKQADQSIRAAALRALGKLAEGSSHDACDRDCYSLGMRGIGGSWSRPVEPLSLSCETQLSAAKSDELAQTLMPLLDDADEWVRYQAADALGEIGSPVVLSALKQRKQAKRTFVDGAIESIERLEQERASSRCGKKP